MSTSLEGLSYHELLEVRDRAQELMNGQPREKPRFKVQQHPDGQIFVTELEGDGCLHAVVRGQHDIVVQIMHDGRVEIDKLYGPLIMFPIVARIDFDSAEWVIERMFGESGEWRVMARFPGQLDEDFD